MTAGMRELSPDPRRIWATLQQDVKVDGEIKKQLLTHAIKNRKKGEQRKPPAPWPVLHQTFQVAFRLEAGESSVAATSLRSSTRQSQNSRASRFAPSLVIPHRLNTVAEISELCRRWRMNRIRAPAASADEPRAVTAVAGELETLPSNETPFKTSAHQAAIVGNAVESAELVRAYMVTRGKMTAEMLEVLPALWAREAITIEPGINRRDRMKLTRIQIRLSIARMTSAPHRSRVERGFFG
jgi:hypothetical protein